MMAWEKSVDVDGTAAGLLAHHVGFNGLSRVSSDCAPHLRGKHSVHKFGVVAVARCWGGVSVMPDWSNKHPMTTNTLAALL